MCESNGATAVFRGRLDQAIEHLWVGRIRRRQEIGDAASSVRRSPRDRLARDLDGSGSRSDQILSHQVQLHQMA